MFIEVNNRKVEVIITKKTSNKHSYMRLKDDGKLYINTSYFMSKKNIDKFIKENISFIEKSLKRLDKKEADSQKFIYLGKEYIKVYWDKKQIVLKDDKVYLNQSSNIDAFLRKEAKRVFLERLDIQFNNFSKKIPYPSLIIRKMTSRWGVCNIKAKKITLNLELIKKDLSLIDYVIVHELAHFVQANHSEKFWNLVEENYKDYKSARKVLKN